MNKKIIQGMIIGFVVLSVILGMIFYSYYVDKGSGIRLQLLKVLC